MPKNLVIVESPAKASTISKYLGKDFDVLASYGHVRDLIPKEGAVNTENQFTMKYQIIERNEKHVKAIIKALKNAEGLYLATDPDREGEAISWHLVELLKEKGILDKIAVHRVVFHEITKQAVRDAVSNPREISTDLVGAQQARRALDYLVGFTLSPVLWRKLPGSRSAGRVQSVALRMICERETAIESFNPVEYWSVKVELLQSLGKSFTGNLTHLNGERLNKLALKNEQDAQTAVTKIKETNFIVSNIEKKKSRRNRTKPASQASQPAKKKPKRGQKSQKRPKKGQKKAKKRPKTQPQCLFLAAVAVAPAQGSSVQRQ